MAENSEKKNKKKESLNAITILMIVIAVVAVLSWIIPAGQYELDEAGNYIAGTYHTVESTPQGIWDVLTAPIHGMIGTETTSGAIEVSLFILVVGGFLGVVNYTGALDAGIAAAIRSNRDNMDRLIWFMMALFGLGGSTYGMAEETVAFYPLIIPIMVSTGLDSAVGVAVVLVGSALGVLASTVNPFATGVAADMAGISMGEGIGVRLVFLIVMYVIGALYVTRYAHKVWDDEKNSVSYDELDEQREEFAIDLEDENAQAITKKQKRALILFGLTFLVMILSLIPWEDLNANWTLFSDIHYWLLGVPFLGNLIGQSSIPLGTWYLGEITMLFMVMAVVIGLVYGLSENEIVTNFIDGTKDLMSVALVVAVARGIQVVMNNGQITATILHWGEESLANLPAGLFIFFVYIFYILMSFLIPSTSGLAAATMGIMAPLGLFAGVAPHLVITAYQAGSGIVNLVTPTSGVVMSALSIGKIGINTWLKWIWKLLVIVFIASTILLVGAAMLGM